MTVLAIAGLLAPAGVTTGAPPYAGTTGSAFLPDLPPPAHPPTVCLVDTGVTPGPLTGDVLRTSMTDLDPGDAAPEGHGTVLAGVVRELVPAATVQSVRVARADRSVVWDDIARGIRACARDDAPGPHVITVSIEGAGELPGTAIAEAIRVARARGMSVIAAAGNHGGSLTGFAAVPGVVPVAALTPTGTACPFTARGADVLAATGCPVHAVGADGVRRAVNGTSFAVPQAAAALAALRAHRPDLPADQAEQLLITAAAPTPDGLRRLDTAAAFRRAGLAPLVPPAVTLTRTPAVAVRRINRSRRHVTVHLRVPPPGWRPVVRGAAVRVATRTRLIAGRSRHARTVRVALGATGGRHGPWRTIRIPARALSR